MNNLDNYGRAGGMCCKAPVAPHGHSLQATGNAAARPPVRPECSSYLWTAPKIRWRRWALCLLLWCAGQVFAAGIYIEKAEARLTGEGYVLSANFDIQLSQQVEDALHHNVTLYFVSELSLYRSRWYWPDTEIALHQQTSKLTFNSLTRQYRISRSGLYQSFSTLQDALHVLGRMSSTPINPALLDNAGDGYFSRLAKKGSRIGASAALRLDVSQLPKPLQINAIASDQWRLEATPFHWEIKPEKPAEAEAP